MRYEHRADGSVIVAGTLVHDVPREAARMLGEASRAVSLWQARAQQRRALKTMTNEQLRDIGINRIDALREGYKPFWRA